MSIPFHVKQLYNTFLKVSRTVKNEPWKPRKSFDDFPLENINILTNISDILDRYEINPELYFKAPYELWGSSNHYDLKFFSSYRGYKAYNSYIEKLLFTDWESDVIIQLIKDGWLHIYKTCRDKKLKSIEKYFTLKNFYPEFLIALSERKITYFNVLGINNYDVSLKHIPREDVDFVVRDFYNTIETLRVKYYKSDKLKQLNNKIIKALNQKL